MGSNINTSTINIYVKCWLDANGTYYPNGKTVMLNVKHQKEGYFGVTVRGEVFPIPSADVVPPPLTTSPPTTYTDFQQQTAMVSEGTIFPQPSPYPVSTDGIQMKSTVRVKDLTTMVTSYLDAADYAAQVANFNFVPYNNP